MGRNGIELSRVDSFFGGLYLIFKGMVLQLVIHINISLKRIKFMKL